MSSPAVSQQEGLLNRYAVAHELGSGRFGRSVLATDTKTNNLCALKYINAPLCDGTSAVLNTYLRIKHPNVLRHLAFVSNHRRSTTGVADSTVIVTEYAGFGSLKREVDRRREMFMESDSTKEVFGAAASEASSYGVLSSCEGSDPHHASTSSTDSVTTPFEDSSPGIYFSLLDIIQIMIQLLLAIRHLHKQKEIHRDITLQNIFLTEPDRLIKLGHCHAFDYEVILGLQPPELIPYLKEHSLSPRGSRTAARTLRYWKEPCDIWAFGCALYEIVTLRPIRPNWEQFLGYYLRQHSSEEWASAFEKIIRTCLQPDPALRSTINMLMSMREVLLAYNLLVTYRDIAALPKLRHVLYYWEKSASKKLQLKGIVPTAVYIPQPILTTPMLKSCQSLAQNSLSEEQILSPGRTNQGKSESSIPMPLAPAHDNSRAGRSYKLPTLTNPAYLNAVGPLFQQPTEYRLLSRSTIRRSLSQEARDKFSKIEGRSAIPPRRLHQGFPSARSARVSKVVEKNSTPADKKHRQTIASEAAGRSAVLPNVPSKLGSAEPDILRPRATLGRETTPPGPVRGSMLSQSSAKGRLPSTRVRRVGSHYEVPIPREDRQGFWRDIQARAREYNLIEAAMKACVAALDAPAGLTSSERMATSSHADDSPKNSQREAAAEDALLDQVPLMVSMHKPTRRLPLPSSASWLFSRNSPGTSTTTQRALDLIRIASAENTPPADCRRTIGRMTAVYQSGQVLPTSHMTTSAWNSTEVEGPDFLSFTASGRYRSASHEHC